KLTVSHLLLTHGHIDHIAACGELAREMNAKICLHQDDEQLFDGLKDQARQFGVAVRGEHNTVDHYLKDGEALITQEGLTLKVLHTPGHSPGSVCFYADDFTLTSPKGIIEHIPLLCCGDTLFLGSIGRTDLWGGDHRALISGVKNKIFTLPDDTLVIPGHGPTTSVGQEKATNSFFQ
ncbi:MAG TPA: MBL fold metallo-hydrolase, partial [bacterium]|nr:MBL fold metallo-hydrolase [bacterium]